MLDQARPVMQMSDKSEEKIVDLDSVDTITEGKYIRGFAKQLGGLP